MSPHEVSWRVSVFGRATRDRAISALRPPRWDRDTIWTALAAHLPRRRPASEPDWLDVHRDLAAAIRGRRTRFAIDPSRLPALRDAVLARWPGAAQEAAIRAERIVQGRYDVLGYRGVSFLGPGGGIDWHADPVHGRRAPLRFWSHVPYLDPATGDHKIIWELNRHQHWLVLARALWLTGNPTFGEAIVSELEDWLPANPPLLGINWASMLELGFRSLAWLSALHLLIGRDDVAADRPWLVDLLVGLDRQLHHVERNLSHYFSPNTHLTGEALALYAVGMALPELAASTRWIDTGRAILLREIDRQIAGDGGHAERATHYHRYTLDFYVLAALVAEENGDSEAATRFTDAVERLARFLRAMADDTGRIPHIGDDDGGMLWPICTEVDDDVRASLSLAAAVTGRPELAPWSPPEEALWVGWKHLGARQTADSARKGSPGTERATGLPSTLFPDTGFAIMRAGGHHLVFDVGPHGYLNGGHAHADALAITLSVNGVPFLVDPGTATYTMNPVLRDRFRRSVSHNTLTVDGRSFAEPAGPFHWHTRTDAALATWRTHAGVSWAEAAHAGYRTLRHRRNVVAAGGGWLVIDEVIGDAPAGADAHRADMHWHFHPDWLVRCADARRVCATHAGGQALWLLHDTGHVRLTFGGDESELGWYSPRYGALVPTWTACVTHHGPVPLSIATWIGEAPADGTGRRLPALDRVPVDIDAGGTAIGLQLHDERGTHVTALRTGDEAARPGRRTAVGCSSSDARLLQYSATATGVERIVMADATFATISDGTFSVAAETRVDDLSIAIDHQRLIVHSSAPVALRLGGRLVGALRRVALNGREWSADAAPDGELRIPAGAWHDAGGV